MCQICSTASTFREAAPTAALWTYSEANSLFGYRLFLPTLRGSTVKKIVIAAAAMFAVVSAAGAADLPRKQPVYQEAPVGKMPIGKSPVGKAPIGKGPVVSRY